MRQNSFPCQITMNNGATLIVSKIHFDLRKQRNTEVSIAGTRKSPKELLCSLAKAFLVVVVAGMGLIEWGHGGSTLRS